MRVLEEKKRYVKDNVFVKSICDACKKETNQGHKGTYSSEWGGAHYDIEKTAIYYKSGSNFPECYNAEVLHIDLCPDCFEELIIKPLQEKGIEWETTEECF